MVALTSFGRRCRRSAPKDLLHSHVSSFPDLLSPTTPTGTNCASAIAHSGCCNNSSQQTSPFPAGSSRLSQPNRVHLSLRSIWFFSLLPTPPHGDAVTSSSRRHIGCQRPRSLTLKEDAALQRTGMALRAVRRSACQLSGAIIRKPALTDSTTERAGNGTRSVTPKVQDFVDCAYPKKHLGCDRNPMSMSLN
jgi:hypothetical protein